MVAHPLLILRLLDCPHAHLTTFRLPTSEDGHQGRQQFVIGQRQPGGNQYTYKVLFYACKLLKVTMQPYNLLA
jgi:hypothetical protein